MNRRKAFVRDEKTANETWAIYVEQSIGGPWLAARFEWKDSADRVAAAINRAYEREGRLLGA